MEELRDRSVLVIGLGVDFGIHFCMRYAELLRGATPHEEALAETTRSVGGSLVLCAFTTAMGFFVFVPTDYKAVGELGLIGGMGMGVSLIVTLTFLPALQDGRRTATWIQFPVVFEPDSVRVDPQPSAVGDPYALPFVPEAERWQLDEPLYGVSLLSGEQRLDLGPAGVSADVVLDMAALAERYRETVLEGRRDKVLVDGVFRLQISLEPLLDEAERRALPAREIDNLDRGLSGLIYETRAEVPVSLDLTEP